MTHHRKVEASEPTCPAARVIVGVCGGIAAYKVCHVVSRLVQRGVSVRVVMTESATRFVGPATFASLTGRPVHVDLFESPGRHHAEHIALARDCDLLLIAPATANTIGKLAGGICDNLLTTVATAIGHRVPVWMAPAMNGDMWANPIVQRNVACLQQSLGYRMIGPADGYQACGSVGAGRMADADEILDCIVQKLG